MQDFSFVFTIFFILLGPLKIVPAFAALTQNKNDTFARAVAIRAALIASAVVTVVALLGTVLLNKYRVSIDGLQIAAGVVLLVAALITMFVQKPPQPAGPGDVSALQLAVSPLTSPVIVAPAGVAAILIFMMLAPEYPGMRQSVWIGLAIIMALDFLAMYFNRALLKARGLMLVLGLVGEVLVFMQAALATETFLTALRHMGVIG